MNVNTSKGPFEVITIGLGPDEKLLESVTQAAKDYDIKHGAIISGIGALKRTHIHYANKNEFPGESIYYVIEEPAELGSLSGLIVNYEPHLHIDICVRDTDSYMGHLENDTIVLYLVEICILKFNNMDMKREIDPRSNLRLLK